ncbi:MAG: hypothetical protein Q8R28_21610 [Dehalococcoidia bacterium]|nr:hypothetical protein [Dehalococcoidia bacterium]
MVALGVSEGQAKATGKGFKSDWAMVWKVKDGKICYYHSYIDTANLANTLKS